jgi:hypothetical protein
MQARSEIMVQCQLNITEGWTANETKPFQSISGHYEPHKKL